MPLPEPFGIVAKVVFAIVAILLLLSLVGGGGINLGLPTAHCGKLIC